MIRSINVEMFGIRFMRFRNYFVDFFIFGYMFFLFIIRKIFLYGFNTWVEIGI